MAGFNRNEVADIHRNARPTSSEYASICRGHARSHVLSAASSFN
jgi:hypothetical protein